MDENFSYSNDPAAPAHSSTPEEVVIYPPKPPAEEPKSRANILLRSITSLFLYLAIGFYFFSQNWTLLLVLTAVVIIHELGHFFAMKIYDYKDLGIFFIPLVGAYASGKKHEVSQKQSAIILLAGPVPGIFLGILLHVIAPYLISDRLDVFMLHRIAWILIYLNLFNLLPVYPLDGGQLLNRLFLEGSQFISKIFLLLSVGGLIWLALYGLPQPVYPLLVIPAFLLMRMAGEVQLDKLTKKIEAEGIDLNTTYEEISNEKYWQIRNVLIRHHIPFQNIPEAPPYEYAEKEEQIKNMMQNLLQRTLVQDLSIAGKIIIILLWIACFIVPSMTGMGIKLF
jgi:Zn-dependent protease